MIYLWINPNLQFHDVITMMSTATPSYNLVLALKNKFNLVLALWLPILANLVLASSVLALRSRHNLNKFQGNQINYSWRCKN